MAERRRRTEKCARFFLIIKQRKEYNGGNYNYDRRTFPGHENGRSFRERSSLCRKCKYAERFVVLYYPYSILLIRFSAILHSNSP